MSDLTRFWSKVNKQGPVHPVLKTRCWLWTGAVNKDGYGCFWLNGALERAHRVAWFLITGSWPSRLVLHKRDQRACIRHAHHFEGSQADNVHDCVSKNRNRPGRANSFKTHCKQGHSLADAYVRSNGHRKCRTCSLLCKRRRRENAKHKNS